MVLKSVFFDCQNLLKSVKLNFFSKMFGDSIYNLYLCTE